MRLDKANAALPLDVRRGSAFPAKTLYLQDRGYALMQTVEAQPLHNSKVSATERQSRSAHRTAEPNGLRLADCTRLRPFIWGAILGLILSSSANFAQGLSNPPRAFLINSQKLAETKHRIQSGDKTFAAALAKLESDAQKALRQEPVSVVTKAINPPSGDKHDYMSQAPYFWPDPKKPDGLTNSKEV